MSDALTPERMAEIREHFTGWIPVDDISNVRYAQDLIAHVDHLTAKHERARADWKTTIKFRTTQRNEERAENARLREGIEALHRPVHPVFSWNSGLRFDEPCPECNGKAGVHSCGCWSDEDAEFVCFECSRPSSGYLRRDIPWPCATAALLNPTERETDDRR